MHPSRSGLGLSIVSAVGDAHAGSVTYDTSPATGTTVRVVLPAHGHALVGSRQRSAPEEVVPARSGLLRPVGSDEYVRQR
ncbi:MAG: hypothetical protein QOF20_637 [Acidimicrobiaceae bacterium]|nr:hypothetical protein [Acidimicrobiaceae bacterium]